MLSKNGWISYDDQQQWAAGSVSYSVQQAAVTGTCTEDNVGQHNCTIANELSYIAVE